MQEFQELFGFGNFLRSQEMECVKVIVQEHLAHDAVERLGSLGSVQFTDLNGDLTAFRRAFTPLVKRCDELEKKLRFFEDEMKLHGLQVEPVGQGEFAAWQQSQADAMGRDHRGMSLLDYWEAVVAERHKDYIEVKAQRDRTAAGVHLAVQRRFVIEKASEFFAVEQDLQQRGAGAGAGTGLGGDGGASSATASAGSGANAMEAGHAPVLARRAAAAEGADGGGGAGSALEASEMRFKHIAGILDTDDKVRFARIVFRASYGQAVVRFADIPVDLLDERGVPHAKSVFAVFYRGRSLTSKLDRICTAFSASLHDIPNFAKGSEVAAALAETKAVIHDSLSWLAQEHHASAAALTHLALLVRKWRMGVQREKATYHALNMFVRNTERGTLEAQGWVLKTGVAQVQEAIRAVHVAAAAGGRVSPFYFEVLHGEGLPTPPTYFPTNKFTAAFQGFVDTYGVPRYREANPALWAIVTFPFLFGVMYGDMGHATILTLVSAWIVWNEAALASVKNEMFVMVYGGRYMLLLMGLFSIYCGAIYNDVFSLGATLFPTSWSYVGTSKEAVWSGRDSDVYPFGIDPEWHLSDNDLLFFNSLKMKLSVVLGITQMSFGLLLKTSNAIHFGNNIDLFCECLPQLIFMIGLFGYMIFLIFLKWSIDWRAPAASRAPAGAPPSLIDTMINIALKPGTVSDTMYEGQIGVQTVILLAVFICVPVMLFIKPYLVFYEHANAAKALKRSDEEKKGLLADAGAAHRKNAQLEMVPLGKTGAASPAGGTGLVSGVVEDAEEGGRGGGSGGGGSAVGGADGGHGGGGGGHDEHSFGELFIHQAIETIEFVLGSVSNTASYLRLWALSLAHSQLATVFWERALIATVEMDSTLAIVIGYGAFAGITAAVLLLMDVLECFLHALRLHWVEFQNKFYKADGYRFEPFSFAALADAAVAAEA